jgi:hypothetical protein
LLEDISDIGLDLLDLQVFDPNGLAYDGKVCPYTNQQGDMQIPDPEPPHEPQAWSHSFFVSFFPFSLLTLPCYLDP